MDHELSTFCSLGAHNQAFRFRSPTVVANSLPVRVIRQMSPQMINWVSHNKDALLDFWYHGDTWTQPEVNDFIQKLERV